jgi:phosphatidylglycerophosphatase A
MSDPRPPSMLLVTTFGLGHLRPASGTWGSMPPVAIAGALILLGAGPVQQPAVYYSVLAVIFLVFGTACVRFGGLAEAVFGKKDPGQVVADETCAQCIPLAWLPIGPSPSLLQLACVLGVAFVAFRVMDIVKPWPARGLQRVPGGWGILIDDLFAGVYALVVVQVVFRYLWPSLVG